MPTETTYHYLASYTPFYLFFTRRLYIVQLLHRITKKKRPL